MMVALGVQMGSATEREAGSLTAILLAGTLNFVGNSVDGKSIYRSVYTTTTPQHLNRTRLILDNLW
jgi:hypothetical protein